MDFTLQQIILLSICGGLIGAHKTGLTGVAALSIPLAAAVFGAKLSTGVLLPILIMGDIFAVVHYWPHTDWRCIVHLVPGSIVGVVIAVVLGQMIDDTTFRRLIAIVIISCLFLLLVQKKHKQFLLKIQESGILSGVIGLLGGFASMIGNAAGGIYITYFITLELNKNIYVATMAITFFLLNIFKLPFHIFVWHTITWQTLLVDLCAVPGILLGGFAGVKIVSLLSEKYYRIFIIIMTFITAVIMMI